MSQKDKSTIQSEININIADNNEHDITAAKVRTRLIDITDSYAIVSGTPSEGQSLVWSNSAQGFVGSGITTAAGDLLASNNLSDVASSGTSLTNLGITTFAKTILGAPASGNVLNILGLPSFSQSLVSTTNAAAARSLLGVSTGFGDMIGANNLSDVVNSGTSLTNLGITSFAKSNLLSVTNSGTLLTNAGLTTFAKNLAAVTNSGSFLNNLGVTSFGQSLLANTTAAESRSNLGLGTAATQNSTTFLAVANNLSDIGSSGTALSNLGFTTFGKNFAGLNTAAAGRSLLGVSTGTGDMIGSNNLSEITNSGTALTNLGFSTFMKGLVDVFTAAEMRANLGLIFDAPNGVPKLDSDGNLAANIVLDSDTTSNLNAQAGDTWSLKVDINKKQLVLFDGNRYGGIPVGESSPNILNNSVAYFKFDNTIGTSGDATDYIGGNILTNVNAVYQSGLLNNGLSFNTIAYTYSTSEDFNIGGDIGISLWIKLNSFTGLQRILEHETASDLGYAVLASGSHIRFGHTYGNIDRYADWNSTWTSGTWHHLACTYDGTNFTIYNDGSSVATLANASGAISLTNGLLSLGGSLNYGGNIDGEVDELLIANRSFSSAEVSLLYNSGTPPALETLFNTAVQSGIVEGTALTSYSTGTNYTLTGTASAVTFGGTSPSITLPSPGRYRLEGQINLELSGATFAANKMITSVLRRTNQGSTDLPNSSGAMSTGITTTMTFPLPSVRMLVPEYTARAGDVIQPYISLSATPSAGSVIANPSGTWLIATYLGE